MQQPTRVYLDNAATTPLGTMARSAMEPFFAEVYGNASSPYAVSRSARMALDRARAQVAAVIGAEADEIVFTSGGTESDNWAVLGVALRELAQRNPAGPGRILISAIEHHAVLEAAETARELGFDIDIAPVDGEGTVAPEAVARLLRADTRLVSVMAVNNEIGAVQPIDEIASVVKAGSTALFHTDAVQAAGKIELGAATANVDLLSLSGHKFGGPKGAGALYVKRGVKLQNLLRGGGQERGRRAGTENVPAIVGMGAAIEAAQARLLENSEHLLGLRQRLENGLAAFGSATSVSGAGAVRAPHITNVVLHGQRAESLALGLDLQGFAVGTGSACASGALEPSHVLAAMGRSKEEARAALRISFGVQNTNEDVDALLLALEALVNRKVLL
jgi:cysteine desulfurase